MLRARLVDIITMNFLTLKATFKKHEKILEKSSLILKTSPISLILIMYLTKPMSFILILLKLARNHILKLWNSSKVKMCNILPVEM